MSGLTRTAVLVASVLMAVKGLVIVDATSVSQVIRQQQQSTLKDLISLAMPRSPSDSPEQHQFGNMNAARMVETIGKRRTSLQLPTNNNHLGLWARSQKRKQPSIRAMDVHQSSKMPQTYTKRIYFGHLPNRRRLHSEMQSGYGSQTTVAQASGEEGQSASSNSNLDDTGEFSLDNSFNEKRELKPACFPFCFPRYSGKRGRHGHEQRDIEEVRYNADSSHWFATEPKYSQRRCFPFCLPHYSGKRTIDQTEQLAEEKVNENKRGFEKKRSRGRTVGIFAEGKHGVSLLNKPVRQVRRLYERSPLHIEGFSGAVSANPNSNFIEGKN